jgi:thiol-disulfide isomerase/thioredoxin
MAVLLTNDADFQRLLQENEKVVVKYFADWCGSCKLFAPKFRRMSENEAFQGVAFLDVNAEENPEARKMAGVTNLPYFAVFKNGELVSADFTAKEEGVAKLIEQIL